MKLLITVEIKMDPRSSPGTSAYGSAGASGQFDLATYVRKPQVILRMIGVVSDVIWQTYDDECPVQDAIMRNICRLQLY